MELSAELAQLHFPKRGTPFAFLECRQAWDKLTETEKLYAHHFSRASILGSKIVLEQTSKESPRIFYFLLKLYGGQSIADLKAKSLELGVTEEAFTDVALYASYFFANMGNYLGFGDTKFIPRASKEHFSLIAQAAGPEAAAGYTLCETSIYALEENVRSLGLPPDGCTTYYSDDITPEDIAKAQKFMLTRQMESWNTRIFKSPRDGRDHMQIRVASVNVREEGPFEHEGTLFTIVYGDHSESLKEVVDELTKAKEFAANEIQKQMITEYIAHFIEGHVDLHKKSQSLWVQDKGPVIETNIGFIETYRDPHGARAEFEGFVSMVNKERSAKLANLVANAGPLIEALPWPKVFEKEEFHAPDFTSLDVMTFAGSGVPLGINIPNYDDVRQQSGFKNVSLGNVLTSRSSGLKITFLSEDDQRRFKDLFAEAYEIQVAGHELLGHGSGKVLRELPDGSFNFDRAAVNPLNNEVISGWYKPGETYDSVFEDMSSSMEECRAECCGLLLSVNSDMLKIFGLSGETDNEISYTNWMIMARAGVIGLEFFTPSTKKWRQAHMQARFAILQTMLRAGEDLVKITESDGDMVVTLNRAKILTVGVKAISDLVTRINIYRSTANARDARAFFTELTDASDPYWQRLRDIVIANAQPRKILVQANTKLDAEGHPQLVEYDSTELGFIQSVVERF
eukprot:TRINITY_DN1888_c0_g1_i1.p1 TRINITY_DN1888_c0_g1~~TRINITY_DN1888_c0_g1_i1.p1  ORF type:complete len:683 (+),score=161.34 TRINITY_DN1888_c0_g1_i1:1234-3282(+)